MTIKPTNSSGGTDTASNFPSGEEFKDHSSKYNLSKFDYDLYKDEDNKVEQIVRVKYFGLPNKGDRWKVFQENKIILVIEGNKLTKKEREFLRTVEGATWLLSRAKLGIKSLTSLKIEIKNKLKADKD
jgi:hypothetical protein